MPLLTIQQKKNKFKIKNRVITMLCQQNICLCILSACCIYCLSIGKNNNNHQTQLAYIFSICVQAKKGPIFNHFCPPWHFVLYYILKHSRYYLLHMREKYFQSIKYYIPKNKQYKYYKELYNKIHLHFLKIGCTILFTAMTNSNLI